MSIEAMKQAFDKACEAMEAAGKRIDELKAENASLRQAIAETEKIEKPSKWTWYWKEILEENEALRKRIAKAEKEHSSVKQEPVAWMFQHEETGRTVCVEAQQVEWGFEKGNPRLKKIAPLYTSLPQRQPLTDEHNYLICALRTIAEGTYDKWSNGAQAQRTALAAIEKYEAAHGIKGEA